MEIHGTLFDGQSARGREAVLRPADGALVITPADAAPSGEREEFVWALNQVELGEIPSPGAPVRLRCRTMPGAVFIVTDAGGIAALTGLLPHLLDRSRRHRTRLRFTVGAAVVSVVAVLGVYFGWPQIARSVAYWIPVEWEDRLGDSAMSQLKTVFGRTCTAGSDQPGLKALRALAGRLTEERELNHPVTVHVMDWSYKNAFALPGGHVVFTSGIIDFMEGPDELAGVLAHEIGHVERRHVMISLVQDWGLSLLISVAFGGSGGASDVSHLLLASAYSRELEREADAIGLEMLAQAEIDSAGFARLFERFKQEEDEKGSRRLRLPDFISTHPATETRIERARGAAATAGPAMSGEEWAAVQAVCRD